jgi:hypothetical protein
VKKNYLIILALAAGCSTTPSRTDIAISSSGFNVGGEVYVSRSTLASALIAKGVTRVRFLPKEGAEYKQIEAAVGAAQDAGVTDIGLVGNMQKQ